MPSVSTSAAYAARPSVQFLELLRFLVQAGFEHIADGQQPDKLTVLLDGQMAKAQAQELVHELVNRIVVCGEADVGYHVVDHPGGSGIKTLDQSVPHEVALGPDAGDSTAVHDQDRADYARLNYI